MIAIAGVNMIRIGERFGYGHCLEIMRLYDMGPTFIHQDVACKHTPWEDKATVAVLECQLEQFRGSALQRHVERTLPQQQAAIHVLPDAHGRVHAWPCQVSAVDPTCLFKCYSSLKQMDLLACSINA